MTSTASAPLEIDDATKRGHEQFKAMTTFMCDDGVARRWDEWMHWQQTRDPLKEVDPKSAEVLLFRAQAEKAMKAERDAARGPGIAKRARPAVKKKAT